MPSSASRGGDGGGGGSPAGNLDENQQQNTVTPFDEIFTYYKASFAHFIP